MIIVAICCVLSAATGSADEAAVDYEGPSNILKFADALYRDGDYVRAAGEYQRYLFYASQEADGILYRIAASYRLGGRADRAVQFLERILRAHPQSDLASAARYDIGYIYFLTGAYDRSIRFLHESQGLIHTEAERWKSQQLIGLNYLMQKRWSDASHLFNQLDIDTLPPALRETTLRYKGYADTGAHLPSKYPILAGLLSAMVPGAGKVYAGRANDAVFTVLVLALTGWQAVDGFHRDGTSSTKGWVFGSLTGFFYLGNVYGSVVAAQVYNRQVETAFLEKIQTELQ